LRIEPRANKSYAYVVASPAKTRLAKGSPVKRVSRRRLTISVSAHLKHRLEIVAAERKIPVSSLVIRVLEDALPRKTMPRPMGRKVTAEFLRRAELLRKEQSAPFAVDSVELIHEARRERDARL